MTFSLPVAFQSYLSPIQTSDRDGDRALSLRDFNPTLVQFKPHACQRACSSGSAFQSYLSPIQTPDRLYIDPGPVYFNPTLVQFKLDFDVADLKHVGDFNPTLVQFKPCSGRDRDRNDTISILP